MNILTVATKTFAYPIYINDSFNGLKNAVLYAGLKNSKCAVIADTNTAPIYLPQVLPILESVFSSVCHYVFPAGEQSKNLDTIKGIYAFLAEGALNRQSVLIALGGGVTGDMTGFAAATFMRGVAFAQIPTTLLAQVDSSIGGKTGVDFSGHKNYIGAFYQPRFVYVNTDTLKTLPASDYTSGLGECIKHGLISDDAYYGYIGANIEQILAKEPAALARVIETSCRIKSRVVELDEREENLREILNFGHTFGHAIESLSGFALPHGHAVAHGMRAALYFSYLRKNISEADVKKYDELTRFIGFAPIGADYGAETVYQTMQSDKKIKNGSLHIIALKKTGAAYIETNAEREQILLCINHMLKTSP